MNTAFSSADILLPKKGTDLEKWACVACDQYTGEPEYWRTVDELVGDAPSTLRITLPEIYLEDGNVDERIHAINESMNRYLSDGILEELPSAMIYTERTQSDGRVRCGLIGKLDLEQYDYRRGSTSPVRATEQTVVERIPPRVRVRANASLELPHIMILLDDPQMTVIEPLTSAKDSMETLYSTSLMCGGGSASGRLLSKEQQDAVTAALVALGQPDAFRARYGIDAPPLVYAMGDGNHSLATAKEHYERIKRETGRTDIPARYALVELVNLHSSALSFEAIHRIVTGVDPKKLLDEMNNALELSESGDQSFEYIMGNDKRRVFVGKASSNLTVGTLQSFLDKYIAENGGKIDYIHGTDVVARLASAPDSIGFILPDMLKSELFPTVIKDGALPRKTFSMGHAEDKRFYMEARKIIL